MNSKRLVRHPRLSLKATVGKEVSPKSTTDIVEVMAPGDTKKLHQVAAQRAIDCCGNDCDPCRQNPALCKFHLEGRCTLGDESETLAG